MDNSIMLEQVIMNILFSISTGVGLTLLLLLVKQVIISISLRKHIHFKSKKDWRIRIFHFIDDLIIKPWELIFYVFLILVAIIFSFKNEWIAFYYKLFIFHQYSIWILPLTFTTIIKILKMIFIFFVKSMIRVRESRLENPDDVYAVWHWKNNGNEEDM